MAGAPITLFTRVLGRRRDVGQVIKRHDTEAGGEGQSTNVGELGGIPTPTPTPPRPPYLKKNQPENA